MKERTKQNAFHALKIRVSDWKIFGWSRSQIPKNTKVGLVFFFIQLWKFN